MALVTGWTPFFNSAARIRGRRLHSRGVVRLIEPEEEELIRAEVATEEASEDAADAQRGSGAAGGDGDQAEDQTGEAGEPGEPGEPGDGVVTVVLREENGGITAESDSETFAAGRFDEYIWATLLEVQAKGSRAGVKLSDLEKMRVRPPKAKRRDGSGPSLSSRRQEPEWASRLSMLRPGVAESEASGGSSDGAVLPTQRRLVYAVLLQASRRHRGLFVEVRQQTPTASGWSRSKPLRVGASQIATLADPVDRELCSLLLGGQGVADIEGDEAFRLDRTHAVYRLPAGAREVLLKRLIETGRCVIDVAEDTPGGDERALRWDPRDGAEAHPWTPWLVAEMAEDDSALEVRLELRRRVDDPWRLGHRAGVGAGVGAGVDRDGDARNGSPSAAGGGLPEASAGDAAGDSAGDSPGDDAAVDEAGEAGLSEQDAFLEAQMMPSQRMAIGEPLLLLGGLSGLLLSRAGERGGEVLLARFDDRDAMHWVHQFAEAKTSEEGDPRGRVIRVPRGDLQKFLDRLLLLPQLPDMDFPEALGLQEVRVEPRPELELFSTDSPQARQSLPSSLKNHLLARVWFLYGNERVDPAQGGRFLSVARAAAVGVEAGVEGAVAAGEQDAVVAGASVGAALSEGAVGAGAGGAAAASAGGEAVVATIDAMDGGGQGDGDADGADHGDGLGGEGAGGEGAGGEGPGDGEHEVKVAGSAGGHAVLVRRDRVVEGRHLMLLSSLGFRSVGDASNNSMSIGSRQVPAVTARLLAEGWRVLADERVVRVAGTPHLSVTSGIDWFELRGGMRYKRRDGVEEEVPLPRVLAAAKAGQAMIELGDGSQGLLPEAWLEEHSMLTALAGVEGDHLRFHRRQVALIDALLDERELVDVDDTFAQMRDRVREFAGVSPLEACDQFQGELRPYQKGGLGWASFLRWFGVGGVLADDMGLGKTIQVLAMLQARARGDARHCDTENTTGQAHAKLPSLIVAPRSVVFNWIDEAERFTPDLRVMAYAGAERVEMRDRFAEYDVIVTSYGLMRRDVERLDEMDSTTWCWTRRRRSRTPRARRPRRRVCCGHGIGWR